MRQYGFPISQITPNLWLCGVANIKEENLRELDITHVLNTAEELEDFKYPIFDGVSLKIKHITIRDDEDENLLHYLDSCVDHVHNVIQSGCNIVVHCIGGVSRSASVCIAYLVKYQNTSLKEAYLHVLHRRYCICPNYGFWGQLVTYEEALRGSNSVEMLPFIIETVPDLFIADAENRLRRSSFWMRQLMLYWTLHFIILLVQIMFILFK